MGEEKFQKLVKAAKISANTYPVKGVDILLPLGKAILSNIENLCLSSYKDIGYKEVSLPTVLPEKLIAHLRKDGLFKFNNEFGQYFLAPGYETQAVLMFNDIIDNYTMFPVKIFNIGSAYRQTAKTHLIKNLEFRIIEFNSFFKLREDAENELDKFNKIVPRNLNALEIPWIKSKDSKNPNAQHKFFAFFPHSERFGSVACNLIADYKYTQAHAISLIDENHNHFYPVQLNASFTGRMLAAYLSNHMYEERGFMLGNNISPYMVLVNELDFDKQELTGLTRRFRESNISYLLLRQKSNTPSYKQFIASGIPFQLGSGKHDLKIRKRGEDVIWVNSNNVIERLLSLNENTFSVDAKVIKVIEISEIRKEYASDAVYVTDNPAFNPQNKLKFIGFNEENQRLFVKMKY